VLPVFQVINPRLSRMQETLRRVRLDVILRMSHKLLFTTIWKMSKGSLMKPFRKIWKCPPLSPLKTITLSRHPKIYMEALAPLGASKKRQKSSLSKLESRKRSYLMLNSSSLLSSQNSQQPLQLLLRKRRNLRTRLMFKGLQRLQRYLRSRQLSFKLRKRVQLSLKEPFPRRLQPLNLLLQQLILQLTMHQSTSKRLLPKINHLLFNSQSNNKQWLLGQKNRTKLRRLKRSNSLRLLEI